MGTAFVRDDQKDKIINLAKGDAKSVYRLGDNGQKRREKKNGWQTRVRISIDRGRQTGRRQSLSEYS